MSEQPLGCPLARPCPLRAGGPESLRTTIHSAQEAVRPAQADVETVNEAMGDIRVEKAQLEVQVRTAASRIVEELGLSLESALQTEPIEDRQATVDAAHRLRKKIANLGPVNPVAVEEYEQLGARREFLQRQLDDLNASRAPYRRSSAPSIARCATVSLRPSNWWTTTSRRSSRCCSRVASPRLRSRIPTTRRPPAWKSSRNPR